MIKYTEAELEIIKFDAEDIIVTSCGAYTCDANCPEYVDEPD